MKRLTGTAVRFTFAPNPTAAALALDRGPVGFAARPRVASPVAVVSCVGSQKWLIEARALGHGLHA
jgi:hypothetical protein